MRLRFVASFAPILHRAPKISRVSDVTDGNLQFICKEAAGDAQETLNSIQGAGNKRISNTVRDRFLAGVLSKNGRTRVLRAEPIPSRRGGDEKKSSTGISIPVSINETL